MSRSTGRPLPVSAVTVAPSAASGTDLRDRRDPRRDRFGGRQPVRARGIGLGFTNEYRAERAAEALHSSVRHLVTAIRDGTPVELDVTELVPGDVVLLQLGAVVPADIRLLEVSGLECEESVLTGESDQAQGSGTRSRRHGAGRSHLLRADGDRRARRERAQNARPPAYHAVGSAWSAVVVMRSPEVMISRPSVPGTAGARRAGRGTPAQ